MVRRPRSADSWRMATYSAFFTAVLSGIVLAAPLMLASWRVKPLAPDD